MKAIFIFLLLNISSTCFTQSFLSQQKQYSRVRNAISSYEDTLKTQLSKFDISSGNLEIFLRAHKFEEELEVWVKNKNNATYQLFKTIPFCTFSGTLGPKRQQGDGQIPEGIYFIDRFNPYSNFHLSMGINYPNNSDRKLGVKNSLGGDIFIHGSCVSIGCISITDPIISQLYLLAVWAKNNGQSKIPVHIFPFKMKVGAIQWVEENFSKYEKHLNFWRNLQPIYQYFENHKKLPQVYINNEGAYYYE